MEGIFKENKAKSSVSWEILWIKLMVEFTTGLWIQCKYHQRLAKIWSYVENEWGMEA